MKPPGDEKYINCIRTFMDRYIQEDGTIRYYVPEDYNLDKVNNGRVLYFLYDQTGEEKYKNCSEPYQRAAGNTSPYRLRKLLA